MEGDVRVLDVPRHVAFLRRALEQPLPEALTSLDNKPWVIYWVVTALTLMKHPPPSEILDQYVAPASCIFPLPLSLHDA